MQRKRFSHTESNTTHCCLKRALAYGSLHHQTFALCAVLARTAWRIALRFAKLGQQIFVHRQLTGTASGLVNL
jgi:hypothetical protein